MSLPAKLAPALTASSANLAKVEDVIGTASTWLYKTVTKLCVWKLQLIKPFGAF
jgi:hypothetical protein